MESHIKLEVLDIKAFNKYIVRELYTSANKRFETMEVQLQRHCYTTPRNPFNSFSVGSHVCVYVSREYEKPRNLWRRGVIVENCRQKDFLFLIDFVDYGFTKTICGTDLRELDPHFGQNTVPFQAFPFNLTEVMSKRDVNHKEVIKEIQKQFDSKKFIISAVIEHIDSTGTTYGSISVAEDSDLAAILIYKGLVEDINSCSQRQNFGNQYKDGFTFKSYDYGQVVNDVHRDANNCKCDAIIRYMRSSHMRTQVKEGLVENNC